MTNSSNIQIHVLVPAAGLGQRFGGPIPKQYMKLSGQPIIQRSLERLLEVVDQVTVAISNDDDYWQELDISKDERVKTVVGGETRAESVQNALKTILSDNQDDWVLIHDAVRPLVSVANIEKLIERLSEHSFGGLLATPVYETVKRANADAEVMKTEDREDLWIAQTPQMFRYGYLVEALKTAGNLSDITDEALAMEAAGHSLKLIQGCRTNIKITRPEDLEFAELILGRQAHVS